MPFFFLGGSKKKIVYVGMWLSIHVVLFVKMQVRPACVQQQMFLHVSASFNAKFETCPGQHAASESQPWEGKRDRMIGMRVFTVNKNKGWQAGWLLHRNAPCSHLHSSSFFFEVFGCRLSLWHTCELCTWCLYTTRLTTTVCVVACWKNMC